MQEKGVISINQFIWLLFATITSYATIHVPRLLIFQAERDSWISVILAWFLDVLLAVVYGYMGIRFSGQNMVQYSITILGKKIGKVVGVIFPIFFLMVSAIIQRGLSIMLNAGFFPRTPVEIILISSYIVVGYAALKGIEVIGRVCEIIGPVNLVCMLILFLLVCPVINIDRLKPQLANGIYPALSGTPFILSFIGICIIMGMYIPICDRPENGFIAKFIAVSIGCSIIVLIVICSIGVFSFPQAKNMLNTSLELARIINLGEFFERVEAIWIMIAISATIITSANLIWAFCLGISQIAGLKSYKTLVFPAILLSYVIGMTSFENSLELVIFLFYTFPIIAIFVETGLEMFLFFAALILKKKG